MGLKTKFDIRSIFIADDDADDRSFFAEALAEVNAAIELTEFENGMELMNLLMNSEHTIPDVIFLDINMPVYSGMQCLEMIRKEKNNLADIPVVILSTSSDPCSIQKAYDLGANYYAVKPADFNDIKIFLNSIIKIDWQFAKPDLAAFRLI